MGRHESGFAAAVRRPATVVFGRPESRHVWLPTEGKRRGETAGATRVPRRVADTTNGATTSDGLSSQGSSSALHAAGTTSVPEPSGAPVGHRGAHARSAVPSSGGVDGRPVRERGTAVPVASLFGRSANAVRNIEPRLPSPPARTSEQPNALRLASCAGPAFGVADEERASSAAHFQRRPRVDRRIVTGGQESQAPQMATARSCPCLYSSASVPLKGQQKTVHKRKTADENRAQGRHCAGVGSKRRGHAGGGKQHVQLPAGLCLSTAGQCVNNATSVRSFFGRQPQAEPRTKFSTLGMQPATKKKEVVQSQTDLGYRPYTQRREASHAKTRLEHHLTGSQRGVGDDIEER
ncbi:hypothetical protein HPB51_011369 [Rhipicephalus microplus]|uniref:Uncharacterized protein n=1 Tax=Rhipicephalus microplus TaxID=6941 RepID=A0A9J6D9V9_RHIMP|nr:hypothetical protein HPB51_011369 [Rhipicephalus microplus]